MRSPDLHLRVHSPSELLVQLEKTVKDGCDVSKGQVCPLSEVGDNHRTGNTVHAREGYGHAGHLLDHLLPDCESFTITGHSSHPVDGRPLCILAAMLPG